MDDSVVESRQEQGKVILVMPRDRAGADGAEDPGDPALEDKLSKIKESCSSSALVSWPDSNEKEYDAHLLKSP